MTAGSPQFASLTVASGSGAGSHYPLDATREYRIGRGADCEVVLTDPLCSRVHAVVFRRNGQWIVRDNDSRNGTFVNGQKIDEAALADGHQLKVGATEFSFQIGEQPPTVETERPHEVTDTILKEMAVDGPDQTVAPLSALHDSEQAKQLLVLYQLSISLLGLEHPDDVTRVTLELLREQLRASVVGFLWVDEEGRLKPKLVIPSGPAEPISLSQSLTDLVCRQGHAVWVAKQKASSTSASLLHYADAVCAPLVNNGVTLGAIHAYLDHGRFKQSDFDFAISLANILAVGLVRARQRTKLESEYRRLVAHSPGHAELVGESPVMRELKERINRIARTTGCVLIRGESGVGKELVARAVHRASPRADRAMLSVNCAAIPHELMESQLFGHKAGAFTSADRDHIGYFQQADAGTLFLDEVGEMTWEGQAKLLRILEGHPFLPVGATQQVTVDVRVIAATNQNLQEYVRQRKFREDLFYRLSVFELYVPPLRDRGSDIALLVDFFFDHYRNTHGRPGLTLSGAAREKLLGYSWPGNVRQLRNVIDSAVVLASGNRIEPSDLGLRDAGAGELESLRLDYWERRLITEALKRTAGNVPEAAKLLAIGRATLYRKIEEYGIER
jgi:Nif-specific regulatory protein